eukprot:353093-Pleurochrysis_carterae.AAC.1
MSEGRAVGVLVGTQAHGVAGLTVHVAHHVDAATLDEDGEEPDSRTRARVRNSSYKPANERKGYYTFCCGNVVQCTHAAAFGQTAIVFGVIAAA